MFFFFLNFIDLAIFVEKKMGKFGQIQKKKVNNKKICQNFEMPNLIVQKM
jgi:hypothetical protein